MKWAIAAILSVTLGLGLGWRNTNEDEQAEQDSQLPALSQSSADAIPIELGKTALPTTDAWREWADKIRNANSSEELATLFHEIRVADSEVRYTLSPNLKYLLAARWVEVDPGGGLVWLDYLHRSQSKDSSGSYGLKFLLVTEWVLVDEEAAIAAILGLPEESHTHALNAVAGRLWLLSPSRCMDFIKRTGFLPTYVIGQDSWLELARENPDTFLEFVLDIEKQKLEGMNLGRWINTAAQAMAYRDTDTTLAWIREEIPEELRNSAMRGLLTTWAKTDPLGAAEHLGELKRKQVGARSYQLSGADGISAIIVKELAKTDLDAAVEYSANRSQPMRDVWREMPSEELGETFDRLRKRPAGRGTRRAITSMIQEWITRDPAGLINYLEQSPAAEEKTALLRRALSNSVPGRQVGTAEKLLAALPREQQAAAIDSMFKTYSDSHGDIEFYSEILLASPESPARTSSLSHMAGNWSTTDPISALEWAAELPASEATPAIGAAAAGWAKFDTIGLSEHLIEMSPGSGRDLATTELVNAVRDAEPDSAWQWAARIENTEQRLAAQASTIAAWAKLDPAAAEAAISDSDFSENEQEALRAAVNAP